MWVVSVGGDNGAHQPWYYISRVGGGDGELRPWHFIYAYNIESRLTMRVIYAIQRKSKLEGLRFRGWGTRVPISAPPRKALGVHTKNDSRRAYQERF